MYVNRFYSRTSGIACSIASSKPWVGGDDGAGDSIRPSSCLKDSLAEGEFGGEDVPVGVIKTTTL